MSSANPAADAKTPIIRNSGNTEIWLLVINSSASVPNTFKDWPGPNNNAMPMTPSSAVEAATGRMSSSSAHTKPKMMKATAAGEAFAASASRATPSSNPQITPNVANTAASITNVSAVSMDCRPASASPVRSALVASTPITKNWNIAPRATIPATAQINDQTGISRMVEMSLASVSSAAMSAKRQASSVNIQNSMTDPANLSQAVTCGP